MVDKKRFWQRSKDTSNEQPLIDFDAVLEHVGPMGAWQWLHICLLWFATCAGGLAVVVFAFTGYVPKYRCLIPQCEDIGTATYYNPNQTFADFVQLAIGKVDEAEPVSEVGMTCQRLQLRPAQLARSTVACQELMGAIGQNGTGRLEAVTCPKDQLVFDRSVVSSSLVEHYQLTCERHGLRAIFNALYMGGMLCGSFGIGMVSDHFGRMKALAVSVILVGGAGTLGAFVNNLVAFGLLRIATGMGGMGVFITSYVMVAESTLPKYTSSATLAVSWGFMFGELVLGWEAFYIRDWFTLQLVAHTPLLILLILYLVVPESTRWLIAKGRNELARAQIVRGAWLNRAASVPDHLMQGTTKQNYELDLIVCPHGHHHKPNFFDLFRPRPILKRSITMLCQWFSAGMGYYGLLFASTSLTGNPYLNFTLTVLAEVPSFIIGYFLADRWGRRPTLSSMQLILGTCCITLGFIMGHPEYRELQIILSMLGKFSAALGFLMSYLYTAEMYPTVIRNTAIGSCSTIARVGSTTSLMMVGLAQYWRPLPMLIMGLFALLASFLALSFPETVGEKLPETMEDAINIGKNSSKNHCGCKHI